MIVNRSFQLLIILGFVGKIILILAAPALVYAFSPEELKLMDPNKMKCDPEGQIFLLLPSFEDCSEFYMCVHGHEVKFTCPADKLHFDFIHQTCNWPWATDCIRRDKPDREPEPEGSGDDNDENFIGLPDNHGVIGGNPDHEHSLGSITSEKFNSVLDCDDTNIAGKQLPYIGDCQKYWKCKNGLPEIMTCTDGLFFNRSTQQCDYEANAKCVDTMEDELQGEFIVYK